MTAPDDPDGILPRRCSRCGKTVGADQRYPVDPFNTCCARCEFSWAAKKHLGDRGRWAEMRDLFVRQGGRCAYSGDELILGLVAEVEGAANATVDHRTPRSRGGRDEINNLQWVTLAVNVAKGRLTHDEFVALCRKVAANAPDDGRTTGGQ